jgi:hypothetical protein
MISVIRKLIDEFQKTLDDSILGNHQHLLLEGFERCIEEVNGTPMSLLGRILAQRQLQQLITTRYVFIRIHLLKLDFI